MEWISRIWELIITIISGKNRKKIIVSSKKFKKKKVDYSKFKFFDILDLPGFATVKKILHIDKMEVSSEIKEKLNKIHKDGANILFAQLRLEWIPPEYFACLEKTQNAVKAFRQLLGMIGINENKIRERNKDEISKLQNTIGMLLGIDSLGLSEFDKEVIRTQLKKKRFQKAEEKLNTAEKFISIINKTEVSVYPIQIASYDVFVEELEKLKSEIFNIREVDLINSLETHKTYCQIFKQTYYIYETINSQLAWLNDNITRQLLLKYGDAIDGMTIEYRKIKKNISSSQLYHEDYYLALNKLYKEFVAINKAIKTEMLNPAWEEYKKSLEALGYVEENSPQLFSAQTPDMPEQTQLKNQYRKLAMQYHPDRIQKSQDEEVIKEYSDRFSQVGIAYHFLRAMETKPVQYLTFKMTL